MSICMMATSRVASIIRNRIVVDSEKPRGTRVNVAAVTAGLPLVEKDRNHDANNSENNNNSDHDRILLPNVILAIVEWLN